jgi:hypothetical protein
MPLFRSEIHKTTARLRLIRDELLERGLSKTAKTTLHCRGFIGVW